MNARPTCPTRIPTKGLLVLGLLATFGLAACGIPHPDFGPGIEGYPQHQQTNVPEQCRGATEGANRFAFFTLLTYPNTRHNGVARACNATWGSWTSLHKSGRAFDWGVNYYNEDERNLANNFQAWLLIGDDFGHAHAMARRLQMSEVIWNARRYASNQSPPYAGAPNSGHRDHVHFGFAWTGALYWWLQSFWSAELSCDEPAEYPWVWDGENCVRL